MNLRLKLSLSFLLVSLLTVGSIGTTAWWMLMRDFRDAVREQAFGNFQHDVVAYIKAYGSWEKAQGIETFPDFVRRTRDRPRLTGAPGTAGDNIPPRPGEPPFRFLLLTPDGKATRSVADYVAGQVVPDAIRQQAKPILINGRAVLYASSIGEPLISTQDRAYLDLMRRALLVGMVVGALVAGLLGMLLGSRLVARLRELIEAMSRMRIGGDRPLSVPVRSDDEFGRLAVTFNQMSNALFAAQRELQALNATIHAQSEQLREQSLRDVLTGLHNRRFFDEQAQTLFHQSIRYRRPMCFMLADLDRFKEVNDSYSHAVGDAVLRQAAAILQANLRSSDLLARYGGEEFVAVFTESTLAQARKRCEALRRAVAAGPWEAIAPGLQVTLSIGLCADTGLGSPAAMLDAADRQLYRAKEGGRDRVEPAASPILEADAASVADSQNA